MRIRLNYCNCMAVEIIEIIFLLGRSSLPVFIEGNVKLFLICFFSVLAVLDLGRSRESLRRLFLSLDSYKDALFQTHSRALFFYYH